jgi:Tol biopolymer transport system component/tRNA A-37 threonylcarbamoyl transferase component Bud32
MALAEGTRLGPYEILSPLGAGGMGEVYKATDTRLGRTVAIKVLPEKLAGRPDLRERLSREARAVSSLNHPNICALFDVGHDDGTDYLVMEHLEGETLAELAGRGPLPLPDTLKYATQIADALGIAHRKGLIHRDLKPGNVMITAGGAKLLDFGLARSFEAGPEVTSLTAAATATSPLTAQGTIVGTYQYMAPEQLEGGAADARSDIFAFGAVLYEMITGRRAFEGKTQASLIASILKETPRPLTELAPMSPPALHRLVATCLEKDPDARRQTMSDVLLDLRWIAEGGSQAGIPVPLSKRRKRRDVALAVIAIVASAAAIAFATLWRQAASVPERAVISSLTPPEGVTAYPDDGFALSPDGKLLVYSAAPESGNRSLWLRALNAIEATPIAGTQNGQFPFWSPDSRHIGYFADGKLKRVEAKGGPTQALAEVVGARGGSWNATGTIVYTPRFRGPVMRIPEGGGEAVSLAEPAADRGETSHRWPQFLPDGRHVLFLSQTNEGGSTDDRSRIEIMNVESGERRELFLANSSMVYSPTGHILYWSQGALYARPFDAGRLEITGDAFPIVDKVQYTVNEMAEMSVDGLGNLVYQTGSDVTGVSRLVVMERSGDYLGALTEDGRYLSLVLSPDETRLAYEDTGDIWIRDLQRGAATRLTFDGSDEYSPVWSPDGRWVAYSSNRGRQSIIFRKQASGVGNEESIYTSEGMEIWASGWAPDGQSLIVNIEGPTTGWDLWRVPADGGEPSVLVQSPYVDVDGHYSPDGQHVAYTSEQSGRQEIYIQQLAAPGGRWQISTEGGIQPSWRGDGKEIFFLSLDSVLMAAEISTAGEVSVGIPAVVAEPPLRKGEYYPYTSYRDGQKFVVNLSTNTLGTRPLTLIQNWPAFARAGGRGE